MWCHGKVPAPALVHLFPDGTPRPAGVGLTDLPDGRVHPCVTGMFQMVSVTPAGAMHTWQGTWWRPERVPTVKVTCGRCGARWFLLYADRTPTHANIAYRWAPAPVGYSPWTLEVRCSCRTQTAVNLDRLLSGVEPDHQRWQRLGELIIGDGRHAQRNPQRRWRATSAAVA